MFAFFAESPAHAHLYRLHDGTHKLVSPRTIASVTRRGSPMPVFYLSYCTCDLC